MLAAPRGTATRPTSDRLRETLFNVLGPQVKGARFADLYAGSGAVGIEALSRGAERAMFAEKASAALVALRSNLQLLGVSARCQVEPGGTAALLKKAASSIEKLDIVFLDPPYEQADEYLRTLTALGGGHLLPEDGLVVAEHTRRQALQDVYGKLHRTRVLLQGDTALSFFALRREGKDSEA